MNITANTEIYTKSIERYKENKTEFIECTLVDFGENSAEIDEIKFYDEEFKPHSDMLLVPLNQYMEEDDDVYEDDEDEGEDEANNTLYDIIDAKISNASEDFKEAFNEILLNDSSLKYFILFYMPGIHKDTKIKYFKIWLNNFLYPECKENIENNNCIIDEKTAYNILNIISTLYSNSEYETAFKIIMHYIYFLRTLFVMQAFTDIYHNEIAKHIDDTFDDFTAVIYQIKQNCSQQVQNEAANIILNYLKAFRESSGLSYHDSYMALLGVLLTDEEKQFRDVIKYIKKHTLSSRYLKCAYYHILRNTNPAKAADFLNNTMKLEDIFLLAETYSYFKMWQGVETILRPRKNEAEKNSDAIDKYYNILCNTYEDLGLMDKSIDILYEKLEDGYSDAFASIYNEIDHNNYEEVERLLKNAEKSLPTDELITELIFFGFYNKIIPFINETDEEKKLYIIVEQLLEKKEDLNRQIRIDKALKDEVDEIMTESDIQEKELFDKFLVQAKNILNQKEIRNKKLHHLIDKLVK